MSVYLVSNLTATPDTPPTARPPCPVNGCGCAHRVTRYPSDTTDAEWEVLGPQARAVMAELRRGPGGRPMAHRLRAVVDAIRYLVRYGIEWRALPADFPPWEAVYAFFERWAARGLPQRIVHALRDRLRVSADRAPAPTAAIIDSQTVRGADTVGAASSGYDGGKKIKGRKRHVAVDSNGWLLAVLVTAANVQDRDAGHRLLALLRERFSTITLAWADGGYAGRLVTWAAAVLALAVTVVKRTDDVRGFVVLPRRWVVERTFGWLCRHRRLVRDYERRPEHHEAMIWWATTAIMTRQLVAQRSGGPPPPRWGTDRAPAPPRQQDRQAA
ncbi:IS5 family transposase [Pseudonocardia sp.]|uniref:IS5 family transposase n=1 Tax=Pseudonocardia sp. TaxID=60912 RepID=UPI002608B9AF|nr:IS5 family transposase [Pseudonocardia sp.]